MSDELRLRFRDELKTIDKEEVRDFASYLLQEAPDHFWTQPSSSTGKYHPSDEHGDGGLALHSIRVKKAADILLSATLPLVEVYAVKLAALFHDVGRYGFEEEPQRYSLGSHAELGSVWFKAKAAFYLDKSQRLTEITNIASKAILTHMGRWGNVRPETKEEWIVHYADMIASQYTP